MNYDEMIESIRDKQQSGYCGEARELLQQAIMSPDSDAKAIELLISDHQIYLLASRLVRTFYWFVLDQMDRDQFVDENVLRSFGHMLPWVCCNDSAHVKSYIDRFAKHYPSAWQPLCVKAHWLLQEREYELALKAIEEAQAKGSDCVFCQDAQEWLKGHLDPSQFTKPLIPEDLTQTPYRQLHRYYYLARYEEDAECRKRIAEQALSEFPYDPPALMASIVLDWDNKDRRKMLLDNLMCINCESPESRWVEVLHRIETDEIEDARMLWSQLLEDEPWIYVVRGEPIFDSKERKTVKNEPTGKLAEDIERFYRQLGEVIDWMLPE